MRKNTTATTTLRPATAVRREARPAPGPTPTAKPRPTPRPKLEVLGFEARSHARAPLYLSAVAAGFPSPADDFIDKTLDLNEHMVRNPSATFFVRAHGDSMAGAGIASGDLLVVDRAVEPKNGDVIIAAVDGELTVKRVRTRDARLWLVPENPDYPAREITPESDFEVWGVVTYVIHKT